MSRIYVNVNEKKSRINKNIYGHFSEHLGRCIYNGLYVGENSEIPNVNGMRSDVVAALREIKIPVLRWPGGCFADEYHWKDGIGPKAARKKMVNTHWGGVVEDNSFGTHEFMELCRQLGCEPYINGNVGSGTVMEMSEWVEYLTFDGLSPMAQLRAENGHVEPWSVKFWGVGNENWGCGGNMRPEYYADEYRRYATYLRNYGDNKLYKIACGANAHDVDWTDKVMATAGKYMDALSLHYYTLPTDDWAHKGSATEFSAGDYERTIQKALKMEKLLSDHLQIMHQYDPEHRVGLIVDEWGAWYDVEPGINPGFLYQQNTMRDAMVAAVTLNIFNQHADRVVMANLAQTVNVLQSVILTEGLRMLRTPTWHVFNLYKHHQDATLVHSFIEGDMSADATMATGDAQKGISKTSAELASGCLSASASAESAASCLSVSASVNSEGTLNVTAANISAASGCLVALSVEGLNVRNAAIELLAGAICDHNTFDEPERVKVAEPVALDVSGNLIRFTLPACSVARISAR